MVYSYHLYVEYIFKAHFIETENRILVARKGAGSGNVGDIGQRAQTFKCRENKF